MTLDEMFTMLFMTAGISFDVEVSRLVVERKDGLAIITADNPAIPGSVFRLEYKLDNGSCLVSRTQTKLSVVPK